MAASSFKSLKITIVGGGLGGLSVAIALRRAGHAVTIYERRGLAEEVGAGIGIPPNGSKWLHRWGVDLEAALPVVMTKLIIHKWETGEVVATVPLGNYEEKFGYETLGFQRCDLHKALLDTALSTDGLGIPCKLFTDQMAIAVNTSSGEVVFENGSKVSADLIIAADGINSRLRKAIGIIPVVKQASSSAYRHIISVAKMKELGLEEIGSNDATEFWTGYGADKIIIGTCHGGEILGIYSFFPDTRKVEEGDWDTSISPAQLVATFPTLDPRIHKLMMHSEDIKIWRLYEHEPYPYWTRGRVVLLGDAAHPMLPDQAQGHSQAIEDAAALGLIFSEDNFRVISARGLGVAVESALQCYEELRFSRATSLQKASALAREDVRERIGWEEEGRRPGKLTIEDVCGYDMEKHLHEILECK